ncbi:MAG: DUF2076 domain-containing protein [Devosia nanyangense]|nr:DUF2076 domain-containing protein [Devosia nanyangense]
MSREDRNAIEGLFDRLARVEREGAHRDPEAEALIRQEIARAPNSTYYMAQTIVVQEQALEAAERRIEELQRQLGGHLQPQRRNPWDRSQDDYTDRRQQQGGLGGGGGGFLAGAAQTALGVAGGVLLGNMIGGLFSSTPTQAEEFDPGQDQNLDAGQDDGGNDDDMFGGFDTGGDF